MHLVGVCKDKNHSGKGIQTGVDSEDVVTFGECQRDNKINLSKF